LIFAVLITSHQHAIGQPQLPLGVATASCCTRGGQRRKSPPANGLVDVEEAMIAHVSIGVRDIEVSKSFYDATLAPLGYKCIRAARSMAGYGYGTDKISFWVISAERPVPADEKSGLHFCFAAPNAGAVDAFHAAALGAGGNDNGAPGLRPIYGPDYYAAFIIDPDGYRIEAYYGPGES
jgi:catechol 2,3-dioxygenase-like lactoylglutathione lyase family enzyme